MRELQADEGLRAFLEGEARADHAGVLLLGKGCEGSGGIGDLEVFFKETIDGDF